MPNDPKPSLLEVVARALVSSPSNFPVWILHCDAARAALLAAGFPPEALDQPAGEWVVVPNPDAENMKIADEMRRAHAERIEESRRFRTQTRAGGFKP